MMLTRWFLWLSGWKPKCRPSQAKTSSPASGLANPRTRGSGLFTSSKPPAPPAASRKHACKARVDDALLSEEGSPNSEASVAVLSPYRRTKGGHGNIGHEPAPAARSPPG
jgi:hypothetical protein